MKKLIRQLKAGEPVPTGEPRRYPNRAGYVRLRWRLESGEYVECYEHRLIVGLPVGKHVHHRNKQKGDNADGNLELLPPSEHHRLHNPITWDVADAARLYAAGWSLPRLGKRFSVHPVSILRAFESRGIARRTSGEWKRQPVNYDLVRDLHARGMRLGAMARYLGIGRTVLERVRLELGLPAFPPWRTPGVPNEQL